MFSRLPTFVFPTTVLLPWRAQEMEERKEELQQDIPCLCPIRQHTQLPATKAYASLTPSANHRSRRTPKKQKRGTAKLYIGTYRTTAERATHTRTHTATRPHRKSHSLLSMRPLHISFRLPSSTASFLSVRLVCTYFDSHNHLPYGRQGHRTGVRHAFRPP